MFGRAGKRRGPKWRCLLNNDPVHSIALTTTCKKNKYTIGVTRNKGFLWNGVWTQKPKTSIFESLFGC